MYILVSGSCKRERVSYGILLPLMLKGALAVACLVSSLSTLFLSSLLHRHCQPTQPSPISSLPLRYRLLSPFLSFSFPSLFHSLSNVTTIRCTLSSPNSSSFDLRLSQITNKIFASILKQLFSIFSGGLLVSFFSFRGFLLIL